MKCGPAEFLGGEELVRYTQVARVRVYPTRSPSPDSVAFPLLSDLRTTQEQYNGLLQPSHPVHLLCRLLYSASRHRPALRGLGGGRGPEAAPGKRPGVHDALGRNDRRGFLGRGHEGHRASTRTCSPHGGGAGTDVDACWDEDRQESDSSGQGCQGSTAVRGRRRLRKTSAFQSTGGGKTQRLRPSVPFRSFCEVFQKFGIIRCWHSSPYINTYRTVSPTTP